MDKTMMRSKPGSVAHEFVRLAVTLGMGTLVLVCLGLGVALERALNMSEVSPPPPRALVVEALFFRDGEFYQRVIPTQRPTIIGMWSASITQGERLICSGGGRGNYTQARTEPVRMDPDTWTGGRCGILGPGQYHASASWEWLDERGEVQSVQREFDFVIEEVGQ